MMFCLSLKMTQFKHLSFPENGKNYFSTWQKIIDYLNNINKNIFLI